MQKFTLKPKSHTHLYLLTFPIILITYIVQIIQTYRITTINTQYVKIQLHASNHGKIARFKSILPIHQQVVIFIQQYTKLRPKIEGYQFSNIIAQQYRNG